MASNDKPRLGFIGLGQMGGPMARNLMAAGYPVVAYNRSRGKLDAIVAEGATAASSPRQVAEQVEYVFSCVGFPADVERVYLGDDGVVEVARAGQVFCDLSTVGPETHQQIAPRLAERGAGYLDAPISGGVSGAKSATLTIMVGGEAEHFERVKPMLEAMGKSIYHVGPTGTGATIKLVNQMMNAISTVAAAEGLVLATKAGIDPELAYEILRNSSGGSRALDNVAQGAFARDFEPGFTADLMHKDVSLATEIGRQLGVRLLAGGLAEQLMQELRGAGLGQKTQGAALLIVERLSGVEVTPKRGSGS